MSEPPGPHPSAFEREIKDLQQQLAELQRRGEPAAPLQQALELMDRMRQSFSEQSMEDEALKQQLVAHQEEVRVQDQALEENLKQREELYAYLDAVFRQAPMGYLVLRPHGGIRDCNLLAEEYLGAAGRGLTGSDLKQWIDTASWLEFRRACSDVLRHSLRKELELTPAQGVQAPECLYAVLRPLNLQSDKQGLLLCSLLDISDQRRTHQELLQAKKQLEQEVAFRKDAQRDLERQEARIRRLIAENADAMLVVSAAGQVLLANPAASRLLGREGADLQGLRLGFTIVPSEVVLEQPGEAAPRVAELRFSEIEWEGEPVRLVTLRDVTDRKQTERKLQQAYDVLEQRVAERTRELEQANLTLHETLKKLKRTMNRLERIQKAVKSSGDAIIITNRAGRAEYSNPATRHIFGHSMTSLNKAGGLRALFADHLAMETIRAALASGRSFNEELKARDSEDNEVSVLLRVDALRDDAGKVLAMVAVFKDVSEIRFTQEALESSREEFRNLADNLPDMIARIDLDLCYSFANRALSEAWGHPGEAAYGVCLRDMELPEHLQKLWIDTLEEVLQKGVVRDFEFSFTTEGLTNHYRTRIAPEFDHQGKVVSCVSLTSNITSRVEMERELRHSQKLEALGAMAGKVAHDFNNMLGVIMTSADLIRMKLPEAPVEVARRLQRITEASNQAKSIISRMLGFARSDEPQKSHMDLEAEVRKTMTMLQDGLPATIELDYSSEGGGLMVFADSALLQQIMLNLGLNAKDAIGEEIGRIEVCLDSLLLSTTETSQQLPELEPGWFARLRIADSGTGIPAENLDRIFDPFFTTKGKGKGSGLGLSMVHRILRQHQGAIRVASEPGKGASFTLYLPLSGHQPKEGNGDETPPQHIEATVLVVDDEPAFLESLEEMLQQYGCTTLVFSNAIAALQQLEARHEQGAAVDLLFTDQTMPGMTGTTLIERARKLLPDLPAVLCTGFADNVGAERLQNLNAVFLQKPFSYTQLLLAVAKALQLDGASEADNAHNPDH